MVVLHRIALAALWTLAAVGLACGVIWGASAAGLIKPLVVISGSMEPGIMTGDLVVDVPVDTSTVAVGDVVSLPSSLTHNLVTHRVEKITAEGDGYTITLKGDNNQFSDALDYHVGAQVWTPRVQVPGAGFVISRLMSPGVMIALLMGVLALIALTWITPASRPKRGADRDPIEITPATTRRQLRLRGATAL